MNSARSIFGTNLLLGLFILLFAPVWAEGRLDFSEIHSKNKNSVVFLQITVLDEMGNIEDQWTGTGFIVSSEGHVLTNAHVVPHTKGVRNIKMLGSAASRYASAFPLTQVKVEPTLDLALIKFRDIGKDWEPVQLGGTQNMAESSEVLVLGFPLESNLSAVTGVISNMDVPGGRWQTSTPLNPGNSGGPVFNNKGKVIAIVVGGNSKSQGINYLIPINLATGLLQLLPDALNATNSKKGLGERCEKDSDCSDLACYPGPGDNRVKYCQLQSTNCAFPEQRGYRYGDVVEYEGVLYECYNPHIPGQRAQWRLR